jgi:hypothetical protein
MKCGSRASLLARTFASLCFGPEPKARVAITLEVDSKIFDEVFKKLLDVRILLGLASTLMTILPTKKNRN